MLIAVLKKAAKRKNKEQHLLKTTGSHAVQYAMNYPKSKADGKDVISFSRDKTRILLIDDEELFVRMESRLLERQGYQVIFKTGGSEALELFSLYPREFDLVITSQTLPEITGVELARKLSEIRPDIPIILCTASSQISEEEAYNNGIQKIMLKPLDSITLAWTIQRMIDGK